MLAPSVFLDCSSLDYIFYKFESYWNNNNIKNTNELEKYINQYNEMKSTIGDVDAKLSLLLDFYDHYQKIYFTLAPNDENESIVGIEFPFKKGIFDIKDYYDVELIYLYTFKFNNNKSGYFVSDLMASGKDLWTHIKMLEY